MVVGALLYGSSVYPREDWLIDDALIFQRIVRNALSGRGLGFNANELVEGFSSPLWTLVLFLEGAVGLVGFHVAKATGVLLMLATIFVVVHALPRTLGLSARTAIVALLALQPALGWWGVAGMETPLVCLLMTLLGAGMLRRWRWAVAIGGGLLGVARPEGFIFTALGAFWLGHVLRRESKLGSRSAALQLSTMIVPIALCQLFRLVTFGTILSNSAYAKLGLTAVDGPPVARAGRSLIYVMESLERLPTGWLVASMSLAFLAVRLRRRGVASADAGEMGAAAAVYLQWLYALGVGGDWMPWQRFVVPIVPVVFVWFGVAWDRSTPEARPSFGAVALVGLALVCNQVWRDFEPREGLHRLSGQTLQAYVHPDRTPFVDPLDADIGAKFYAAFIWRFTEPGEYVGHVDIGQSMHLATDVSVIDGCGLTTRFEAEYLHGRHDDAAALAHFEELQPSVVFSLRDRVTGESKLRTMQPWEPVLRRAYVPVAKQRWWGGYDLVVLVRSSAMDRTGSEQRWQAWQAGSPDLAFDTETRDQILAAAATGPTSP